VITGSKKAVAIEASPQFDMDALPNTTLSKTYEGKLDLKEKIKMIATLRNKNP
jgi:hypothetical protein